MRKHILELIKEYKEHLTKLEGSLKNPISPAFGQVLAECSTVSKFVSRLEDIIEEESSK
jgi:hypothetical protein